MRVSRERFTMATCLFPCLCTRARALSLPLSLSFGPRRVFHLACSHRLLIGRLGSSLGPLPANRGFGCLCPFHKNRRGPSIPFPSRRSSLPSSPTAAQDAPSSDHSIPRGRRHSPAVSIFQYRATATMMTSLRITGETRMSPSDASGVPAPRLG